ncbi:MAG: serine dehydratase subunit alpha family protein [Sphaerochaetaceae bacterium]|jgi:L-cysteine desulfidase
MELQRQKQFLGLLEKELVIAMGCTEPAAAALAGAKAAELLGARPEFVAISTSRDMVKNAMGVGLPNCELKGIQAAVALGVVGGDCSKGLGILSVITDSQRKAAAEMAREDRVSLQMVSEVPPLYIEVTVSAGGSTAKAVISGEHDRFSHMEKDGKVLLDLGLVPDSLAEASDALSQEELAALSLDEIIDFANSAPRRALDIVLEAARTNMAIARHAFVGNYGLSVGRIFGETLPFEPRTLGEAFALGTALAASASDARMAGCPMPVMINSGSGNQGITVTVPLAVLASFLKKSDDELGRALCVSELVGLVLTSRKDRLSALCGAFTAAIGTSCGMVYLMGGDRATMDRAVNTMVGNLTGIICDGAKMTCALKIYSCVDAAALSCRLAFKGIAPGCESGIVGKDSLQSIDFLSRISHEGMEQTDRTILSIMMDKQRHVERC